MNKTFASLIIDGMSRLVEEDAVSIGRGVDNLIVVDDPSVSVHHAVIEASDDVWVLRDLGSTNGTKLNGKSVTEAELKNGDLICFGAVEASFVAMPRTAEASSGNNEPQDAAPPVEELNAAAETPAPSLGAKLASLGSAAWQETKRNSQLISLKAQIEKLTRIDLRQAFQDLGRKCYEQKVREEELASRFQEVRALEQRIEEKGKGVHAKDGAKTLDSLRAAALNQASKAAAEALSFKLGGLFVDVGKAAAQLTDPNALPEQELSRVREVEGKVAEFQTVCAELSANKESQKAIMTESSGLGAAIQTMIASRMPPIVRRHPAMLISGLVVVVALVVVFPFLRDTNLKGKSLLERISDQFSQKSTRWIETVAGSALLSARTFSLGRSRSELRRPGDDTSYFFQSDKLIGVTKRWSLDGRGYDELWDSVMNNFIEGNVFERRQYKVSGVAYAEVWIGFKDAIVILVGNKATGDAWRPPPDGIQAHVIGFDYVRRGLEPPLDSILTAAVSIVRTNVASGVEVARFGEKTVVTNKRLPGQVPDPWRESRRKEGRVNSEVESEAAGIANSENDLRQRALADSLQSQLNAGKRDPYRNPDTGDYELKLQDGTLINVSSANQVVITKARTL